MNLYKSLIRPLLFNIDSEVIHNLALGLASFPGVGELISKIVRAPIDPRLSIDISGIRFPNPIALAAGFDKECRAFSFFKGLGFGAIEIGTVTSEAQEGNPKPRIFRLIEEEGLINRMGFPSDGVESVVPRLIGSFESRGSTVIGANIGKLKKVSLEAAASDYVKTFTKVEKFCDYVAINVSSPNTPELRKLQEPARLKELFAAINEANRSSKPIFVKLSPDLEQDDLSSIVNVCLDSKISGLIATNTTITRPGQTARLNEQGGLSGRPICEISLRVVASLFEISGGAIPIIGVGGISSGEDVVKMYRAGASLVQLYTGLIYEGPFLVCRLLSDLLRIMNREGVASISDLRGR